jgi:CRP/FNR family transcriptional regulator, cyclic AMP receptor protein
MVARSAFLGQAPRQVVEGRALLESVGWLSRMPAPFREAAFSIGIWRTSKPGDEIIHGGDERGGMFGIAAGTAEIAFEHSHPDTRFVHLAHAGFWGGPSPLLGYARSLTVVARTPLLWLLLPQPAMERMLADEPLWWRCIGQNALEGFQISAGIVSDLTRPHGLQRAVATLLRLAGCRTDDPPEGVPVEIRMRQADIAALSVMSRNTLNAFLRELAERGLIEARYGAIHIHNCAALRALLEPRE